MPPRAQTNGATPSSSPRTLRTRKAPESPERKPAATSKKRPADAAAPATSPKKPRTRVTLNTLPQADPLRSSVPEGNRLEVFCFGSNSSSELGFPKEARPVANAGDEPDIDFPDSAPFPKGNSWFNSKLTTDALGPLGVENIVMGGMHSFALVSDGKMYSWGNNDESALGRETADEENCTPGLVDVPSEDRINQVSLCDNATFFIDAEGLLYACGTFRSDAGDKMGLISSSKKREAKPVRVTSLSGKPIAQVATGVNHVVALSVDGLVYTWGNGSAGELGHVVSPRRVGQAFVTPQVVPGLKSIVAVWSGHSHSFALNSEGQLFGWGLNAVNQLGLIEEDGPKESIVPSPRHLSFFDTARRGSSVKQVAGGAHHSLFLLEDGRVFVCGRFSSGQLGLGDEFPEIENIQKRARDRQDERRLKAEEIRHRLQEAQKKTDEANAGKKLSARATKEAEKRKTTWEADLSMAVAKEVDEELPSVLEAIEEPTLLRVVAEPNVPITWISATQDRSLAVDSRGRVWTWGSNDGAGGIGLGRNTEEVDLPTEIAKFRTSGIVAVKAEAGGQASIVLGYRVEKPAAA